MADPELYMNLYIMAAMECNQHQDYTLERCKDLLLLNAHFAVLQTVRPIMILLTHITRMEGKIQLSQS